MRLLLLAFFSVLAAGCSCGVPNNSPDGGSPSTGTYAGAMPPANVLAALPTDDAGRPVLMSSAATFEPGWELAFVYDANRDGPLVRYGQCLGVVTACLRNGGQLEGCAEAVPACGDDSGGAACCAPACIAQYQQLRGGGASVDDAFDGSFVLGDCLTGFAEVRARVEVQP